MTHKPSSESNSAHNPTQAVALSYDGQSAPFISASGGADLAEEILRIAREHEVPIYENPELVDILARLEVGDEIPELLYRTIAEIIAFVYMLKGKVPEGFGNPRAGDTHKSIEYRTEPAQSHDPERPTPESPAPQSNSGQNPD
ncbi:EscU/YscU/HrcU family type III secretion system export apparatus switch protein [Ketobacter sp. MCCC 1A13808]|uniref:EscU/YscU/HrcU family type III secretion system export apparatus switch protein n=1 Tax=Ketobacter sp. MCCC 1A13808 TaxID=2602738 RepID=UPI0012ECAE3A|nr:EscU/YscU/HrcU family type III secretion system export apparatus switch protein [Ketobacter sp. MCCC 1A13808]MVF10885.1 EscU/YscU/HrcU family type III secretion system export apparatus switch protein [Ketobacter sp. MCCC 1A13808]